MKKLFIYCMLAVFAFANTENLKEISYWKDKFVGKDLKFGYYEAKTTIITVNKYTKDMRTFFYEDGVLAEKFTQNVITGKKGDKQKEGDLKTPVGLYDITSRFTPPDRYYGPLAFELSYPNLLDKISKKTGSGIWIHGFPMDGRRDNEVRTRGCVAMDNDRLLKFGKVIEDNGLVLIDERHDTLANDDDIAFVMAFVFKWKSAWRKNDIDKYLKFYSKDFVRFDGMNFGEFVKFKKRIFAKNEQKEIKFSNFAVTPYPNEQNLKIYRVVFHEDYSAPSHKFSGKKELYVRLESGKAKIITER
ncbi:L,D-transpeptidase family protein [Campylobacter sp. RM16187]|uniref:L,D-transpeptidase family protein n=1 Tax=Campylobacter sp. RM16187 TaxID=1660063 RepID=UPI0021B60E9F|nr:L,D-transpeptidase family protein [Campylobacter sp. RM16187]QKG28791.1 peptidoglycan LD-carboxypeptidase [Campylobacter sp. RM16187]